MCVCARVCMCVNEYKNKYKISEFSAFYKFQFVLVLLYQEYICECKEKFFLMYSRVEYFLFFRIFMCVFRIF